MDAIPASEIWPVDLTTMQMPTITMPSLGELGLALITIGALAGIVVLINDWRKRKGYRMIVKDRNQKEHALLLDIFTNGLLEANMAGKISEQRLMVLMKQVGRKLGLLDLLPKKTIAPIIKAELKRDKHLRAKARKEGTYVEHPNARVEELAAKPYVREKMSSRMGRSADRFLKKAS